MLSEKLKEMTEKCNIGNHSLKPIYVESIDSSVDNCIMWCSVCGAIVIDKIVDGRVMPGYKRKMELSEIVLEIKKD